MVKRILTVLVLVSVILIPGCTKVSAKLYSVPKKDD